MRKEDQQLIYAALEHFSKADAELKSGVLLLNELLGAADALEDLAQYRRTLFRFVEDPPQTTTSDTGTSDDSAKQEFVEFTEKEIKQMPKHIQRLIIIDKKRCRLETRSSGKKTTTYQIRYRRNGYQVSACGKTIELAKENFLQKIKTAKPKRGAQISVYPDTFHSFAVYYFENFRKEKVVARTFKTDMSRYNKYLKAYFDEKPLSKITPTDCKTILQNVKSKGYGKTADELYSLMNAIFNAAITHRLIEANPLATVLHIQHDRVEGEALSPEEEKTLLAWIYSDDCDCATEIALLLFTGLRSNELDNEKNPPQIQDGFIKAVNSKRHFKDKNRIEFKFIPICNQLRHFLKNGLVIRHKARAVLKRLQKILPNHVLKDLRTTFYTKCQICKVEIPALKEFMGHSFGKLGNAYSDLTKYSDYLLSEGKKLNEW